MNKQEAKKAKGLKTMSEVIDLATRLSLDADVREGVSGKAQVGILTTLACQAATMLGIENPRLSGLPWPMKPKAILSWAGNDACPRMEDGNADKQQVLQKTSPVFPDLHVGTRVRCSYRNTRGVYPAGKVIGFKDLVDLDLMDYEGLDEEEATVKGGAFVVLLDKDTRPRVRDDSGAVHEIAERDVSAEEYEEWEIAS